MNKNDKIIRSIELIMSIIIIALAFYGSMQIINKSKSEILSNNKNNIVYPIQDKVVKTFEEFEDDYSIDNITRDEIEKYFEEFEKEQRITKAIREVSTIDDIEKLNYIEKIETKKEDSEVMKVEIIKSNKKKEQQFAIDYNKDGMTYLGNYKITGYNPFCAHCCGKSDGITASGAVATPNYTIAIYKIPFGTKLYIEGYGIYEVQDRGVGSGVIDIAVASHEDAYKVTKRNVPVYIID